MNQNVNSFIQMFFNEKATTTLAKSLMKETAESATLMYKEDPNTSIPDKDTLKEMTIDYANEMIRDFQLTLLRSINQLFRKATINIDTTRNTKANRNIKIEIDF